jgi:flagellar basal body-associated protein FliL
MTEEINYIPEPPESFEAFSEKKKNNKTLWIILAVVAVILICCCLAVVVALVAGLIPAMQMDQFFYDVLPYLQFV